LKAEQPSLKARRLVFIDETSVTTKMVRHYGRCPRGERLIAKVPHGHWKTMTFIAGLRADGLTAPYVIDGAMDGPTFIAYVEQVLAPTLNKGDVVFMDNLRTHKVEGVAEALKAVGAKARYLPAYSPDLNPIEMAFAKLKAALRKGAARTVKALWKLIGKLVKEFAPEECVNYFQHAGYGKCSSGVGRLIGRRASAVRPLASGLDLRQQERSGCGRPQSLCCQPSCSRAAPPRARFRRGQRSCCCRTHGQTRAAHL